MQYLSLPLDSEYLGGFPAPLREAVVSTLPLDNPPGLSEDSPTEPNW